MEKISEMLESSSLDMDERSYKIFLNMYFVMRNFQEVMALARDMKYKRVLFTVRCSTVITKTALKMGMFEDAMHAFRDLRNTWTAADVGSTPSLGPAQIMTELVELACKEHRLGELIPDMADFIISEPLVNTMLSECLRQKNVTMARCRTARTGKGGTFHGYDVQSLDQNHGRGP